jgi:hypothetical protein
MAIIQYGAMVTAIRGSIGGWTFQKNPAGNIIRLRPRQKKYPTEKQSIARNNHVKYLQAFLDLPIAKKELWRDFAELHTKDNIFGQNKTLTGQNWFEAINYNLHLIGQAEVQDPPTYELPVSVPNYSVNLSRTKIEIIFDPPVNPPDTSIIVRTTFPVSVITKSLQQYNRITLVQDSGPYSTIDITAAYEDTHKIPYPPSSDSYCYIISAIVQTVNKNSGIASAGLIKSKSVVRPAGGIGFWIIGETFIVQ